jgi:SAM-dependent methyltransferase
MAELTNICCTPTAQSTCCEPAEKAECCGAENTSCGCGVETLAAPPAGTTEELRETVREKYAAATRGCCTPADSSRVFGSSLYVEAKEVGVSETALSASLGCGVPTIVADLREGETVLDLGSGAGADVLISAHRVGPTGKAIGIDMTDEMLELARANAAEAGIENVEFRKGYLEELPLPDESIDVVISNCVINLSADKPRVLAEAARVLKPGGRFAVSDVLADEGMDERTRADMAAWTGCIAGALTRTGFQAALDAAGLTDAEFRETHRVHEHAAAAIIRARTPLPSGERHEPAAGSPARGPAPAATCCAKHAERAAHA